MSALAPPRGSGRPGRYFLYNNWDFNALGTIYQQQTGNTVFEALDAELAKPFVFKFGYSGVLVHVPAVPDEAQLGATGSGHNTERAHYVGYPVHLNGCV